MSEEMDLPRFFSKVMDVFATSMPMLQEEVRKLEERIGERLELMEQAVRAIHEELGQMRGTLNAIEEQLREIELNTELNFQ